MKLRVLASSLALHTGVLVGAAAWAFGAAGGAPRVPAVVRFEPVASPALPSLDEQAPAPEFEDLEPIQPDEQVQEPSPRPFEPPATRSPEPRPSDERDSETAHADLFAQVRAPEVQPTLPEVATPPPVVPPPATEPAAPPSPAPARTEATALDSRNLPPAYPARAIRDSHSGTVGLVASIDEAGRVTEVTIAEPCPYPELNRAARNAVAEWRYEPARLDGVAVTSEKVVEIVFELRSRSVTQSR